MRIVMMFLYLIAVVPLYAQTTEPVVSKDNISVHTVERGDMPLRAMADGSIASLNPPTAVVSVSAESADAVKAGQTASIFVAGKVIPGKVSSIQKSTADRTLTGVINLSDPLSAQVAIGTQVGSLIDIGQLHNAVFYARPATAKAHAEAFQFVLEPSGTTAKRVKVQYGRQSGPLIEIISGLSPGDRVIVTDTSAWDSSPQILLK